MKELDRKAVQPSGFSSSDSLTALGRLGADLTVLVESKLSLLRIELKEDIAAYIRGGIHVALGGLVAAVGFGFVSAAMALTASTLVGQAVDLSPPAAYSVGFVVVGACLMVGGIVVARRAAQRLMETELTPKRSVQELEKDRAWLRSEAHGD